MIRRPDSGPSGRRRLPTLKTILAAAASLALAIPALAAAADQGGHHRGGGQPSGQGPQSQVGSGDHHGGSQGGGHVERRGERGDHRGSSDTYPGYNGGDVRQGEAYHGDRRGFEHDFRADRRFHNDYRRPPGWYAYNWRHGEFLPRPFWARDFWLMQYWLYELSPPPYGYVWVRYGDEALLIDERTGEIVEVIHDVFY